MDDEPSDNATDLAARFERQDQGDRKLTSKVAFPVVKVFLQTPGKPSPPDLSLGSSARGGQAAQPMTQPIIQTPRLRLRPWREADLIPFAAMNADSRVMEYLFKMLNREESDHLAVLIGEHIQRHGFGLWAVEVPGAADFIGYVGLSIPSFETHFTPCVEIGWRLAYDHWGKGYATEGAKAVRDYAFEELRLDQIVSFTSPANVRSRRVMEKIGMTHNPADDFLHPRRPENHPHREHVLYRLSRPG
jgi:RimJ/RimL family protein N-acetyltransferase